MKRKRRILSLLLSGAMLFSLCTPTVFAETPTQDRGQTITETGGLCEHHRRHRSGHGAGLVRHSLPAAGFFEDCPGAGCLQKACRSPQAPLSGYCEVDV